uniref:Uncharacterized protein n=1 Tax=Anopheles farauti TaxID=69004 RepID=A0A182QDR1_9DIPT
MIALTLSFTFTLAVPFPITFSLTVTFSFAFAFAVVITLTISFTFSSLSHNTTLNFGTFAEIRLIPTIPIPMMIRMNIPLIHRNRPKSLQRWNLVEAIAQVLEGRHHYYEVKVKRKCRGDHLRPPMTEVFVGVDGFHTVDSTSPPTTSLTIGDVDGAEALAPEVLMAGAEPSIGPLETGGLTPAPNSGTFPILPLLPPVEALVGLSADAVVSLLPSRSSEDEQPALSNFFNRPTSSSVRLELPSRCGPIFRRMRVKQAEQHLLTFGGI